QALGSLLISEKKLVFCGSDRRDRSTPLASVISLTGGGAASPAGASAFAVEAPGPPLFSGVPASGPEAQAGPQGERMRSSGASEHLERVIADDPGGRGRRGRRMRSRRRAPWDESGPKRGTIAAQR